jgi:hypothetical protein
MLFGRKAPRREKVSEKEPSAAGSSPRRLSSPPGFFETLRAPRKPCYNKGCECGDAGHTVTLDIPRGLLNAKKDCIKINDMVFNPTSCRCYLRRPP